jgi:hypothetical protein
MERQQTPQKVTTWKTNKNNEGGWNWLRIMMNSGIIISSVEHLLYCDLFI